MPIITRIFDPYHRLHSTYELASTPERRTDVTYVPLFYCIIIIMMMILVLAAAYARINTYIARNGKGMGSCVYYSTTNMYVQV